VSFLSRLVPSLALAPRAGVIAAAIGAALALATPAAAQPDSGIPGNVSLDFPGGTVSEFAATIREEAEGANILLHPDAADVELPPITLEKAWWADALRVLHGWRLDSRGTVVTLVIEDEGSTLSVNALTGDARQATRVHRLRDTLDALNLTGDDVLTAVRVATDLSRAEGTMRYHEETALLLIHGEGPYLEAVEQTVSELRADAEAAQRRAADAERAGLFEQIEALESRIAELQMENIRLKADRN